MTEDRNGPDIDYEGRIYVRPVGRGVTMIDLDGSPELDELIEEAVAEHHGAFLDGPAAHACALRSSTSFRAGMVAFHESVSPRGQVLQSSKYLQVAPFPGPLVANARPDPCTRPGSLRRGPPYPQLKEASTITEVGGYPVRVSSLDHLIAMKEATGRPRDEVRAQELRVLSDELRAPREQ